MRRALAGTALLALLALATIVLTTPLLGYERYVIEGGSMGGAVPRGSIAIEEVVPTREIRRGDVITYRPPQVTRPITHRVVSITHDRVFRTKGDANAAPDPWRFTLPGRTQARVTTHVPLAGYALEALEIRVVRVAAIGIPALLIALSAFADVARQRGRAPIFG